MRIPESIDAGLIRLQRWTLERAEDLDQAIEVSLSELMPFMPWATQGHDLEATTSYLVASDREWDNGENYNYAILTASHEVVGGCGLMVRQGPDVFEIGYWAHSAHAGRGLRHPRSDGFGRSWPCPARDRPCRDPPRRRQPGIWTSRGQGGLPTGGPGRGGKESSQ
jgi:hypothetical protein